MEKRIQELEEQVDVCREVVYAAIKWADATEDKHEMDLMRAVINYQKYIGGHK